MSEPKIAIVGGGLAGLAAAAALAGEPCHVELFEARKLLGGRSASYRDPQDNELVDRCQHVSMGCCTNLRDFCRRTGLDDCFRRDRVLYFFGPDGRQYDLAASRLPAPLHLLPALLRAGYLNHKERWLVMRAMWRLARMGDNNATEHITIGQWLRRQRQSPRAVERFWSVVLTSALSETLDRASLFYARKVFVDGFLATRGGYIIEVPTVPLSTLYDERLGSWLGRHDVEVHSGLPVRRIVGDTGNRVAGLMTSDGGVHTFDAVIVAVPWRHCRGLFDDSLANRLPELDALDQIQAAPITGIHLWFDRPIFPLPHAVLIGRLGEWVFHRPTAGPRDRAAEHYYQVVISASGHLAGRDRDDVIEQVCGEVTSLSPAGRGAQLLRARMITEREAVFRVSPGIDRLRPPQQTSLDNLALAGDWTRTGWPSTMEGAVRSGYLAAEAVLAGMGRRRRILVGDLRRGMLARMLLGGASNGGRCGDVA